MLGIQGLAGGSAPTESRERANSTGVGHNLEAYEHTFGEFCRFLDESQSLLNASIMALGSGV